MDENEVKKSLTLQKVIKFGCKNFETVGSNQRAVCSFCKEETVITDRDWCYVNYFLKHLQRIHTDKSLPLSMKKLILYLIFTCSNERRLNAIHWIAMMLQLLLNKTALKASGCVFKLCRNVRFFQYERYYNFYFVQLQCNWVPIIYAQYLYWYWYLKVRYWYLYWYLDHWYWYWYWYLFVEYLIQDWHNGREMEACNFN